MLAVAVLRPTEPRCHFLLVRLYWQCRPPPVQSCRRTAKVLLYALAYQLLLSVKLVTDVIQCPAALVVAVLGYREYLPVVLYRQ